MRNFFIFFLVGGLLFLVPSCSDTKTDNSSASAGHDPSKPVELYSFMPDSAGIREKFIIRGENFGTDASKVKVFFNGDRESKIIAVNGNMIYCVVPKQVGGLTTVEVEVEGVKVAFEDKEFKYIVKEQVTTVAGKNDVEGSNDGTLAESRFHWITGVGCLTGNNLVVCERFDWRVRMISLDDNKVITLLTGLEVGQPAVTSDRSKAYLIGFKPPHPLMSLDKNNLWLPRKISDGIPFSTGLLQSSALDANGEWLYFLDSHGYFGKIELANPSNVVNIRKFEAGEVDLVESQHLAYHPQMNCMLYNAEVDNSGIIKISLDGKTVEKYAGFNGVGGTEGDRLESAQLTRTQTMVVDKAGNIYLTQCRGHDIKKIDYQTGIVSTIAGIFGSAGTADDTPLKARFNAPWGLAMDEEESFYIGQFWGCSVRKLAIE